MALNLLHQQPKQTGNLRPLQNRPSFPTSGTGPKVLRTRLLSDPGIQNTPPLYNPQGKRPSSAPTPRSQAGSIPSSGTGDAATKTGPRVLNVKPFIVPPTPSNIPPQTTPHDPLADMNHTMDDIFRLGAGLINESIASVKTIGQDLLTIFCH